ncbi:MAG: hypothetical protein Q9181_002950 [Wetmoreana brouardii]
MVSATPVNQLKNGGFEALKASDIVWTDTKSCDGCASTNYTAKRDSTTAPHGGAQMLSVAFNIQGGVNKVTFGQDFPTARSTNYQYSIWTFAPTNGDKCQWNFYVSDTSRSTTTATTSRKYATNDVSLGHYVQTTLTFNSGTYTTMTTYATLDCTANKPGTSFTFYVDDVTVTPA